MAIGGVVLNFVAKTADATRDIGKVTRELGKVDRAAKNTGGALKKIGSAAKLGIAGAAAGAGAAAFAFVGMAKSAIDDAAAAEKLAGSLKKSTGATKKGVAAAEDWINRMQFATGIADDQLRPALERAARSTKDMAAAQKLVELAMDISAQTGKPLAAVITRLAKANDGNIAGLKGLGITLGENAETAIEYSKQQKKLLLYQNQATKAFETSGAKSKEYQTALDKVAGQTAIVNALAEQGTDWQKELGESFSGAAKKSGGTLAGTWERIKIVFGEIGEAIGSAALPPLQTFADWFGDPKNISKVQKWIDKVGEWATAVGEEFRDKLVDFVEYLRSPEGQLALENFANSLKSIADGFKSIYDMVKQLEPLVPVIRTLTGNSRDIISDTAGDKYLRDYQREHGLTRTPRGERTATGGARATSSGGQAPVVNITVNNPKPERASSSVAASLRVARPSTGSGHLLGGLMAGQTLLIDGFDLSTVAGITNWDGLLDTGEPRGDLIVMDFNTSAVWEPAGGFEPHTIVVPILMRATPEDAAVADLLALNAYLGVEVTLTRRTMLDGVLTSHTCQAYMTSRPTQWDLDMLGRVPATLTFQALTAWA